MTFDKWLELSKIDDPAAAKMFGRHRAHISKLRRGTSTPSYELMLLIREISEGAVTLDSWASAPVKAPPDDKMARAG